MAFGEMLGPAMGLPPSSLSPTRPRKKTNGPDKEGAKGAAAIKVGAVPREGKSFEGLGPSEKLVMAAKPDNTNQQATLGVYPSNQMRPTRTREVPVPIPIPMDPSMMGGMGGGMPPMGPPSPAPTGPPMPGGGMGMPPIQQPSGPPPPQMGGIGPSMPPAPPMGMGGPPMGGPPPMGGIPPNPMMRPRRPGMM